MSRLGRGLFALALVQALAGCSLWNRAFHGAWLGPDRVEIATVAVAAASESRKGAGGLKESAGKISIEERTGLLAQDAARGAIEWLKTSGKVKPAQIPESAYTLAPPAIVLGLGKVEPLPEEITKSLAASNSDAYLLLWADEGFQGTRAGLKVWAVLYAKDGAPIWRRYYFAAQQMVGLGTTSLGGGLGLSNSIGISSKRVATLQGGNMAKSMMKLLEGRVGK